MKKFIVAFDGLRFSESAMSYAIFLAKHCKAHLVGAFLEDFMRRNYGLAEIKKHEGANLDQYIEDMNQKDQDDRNESIAVFELACQDSGLNYSVHRDRNVALNEVLHESVYADLLIINAAETLSRYEEAAPSRFMRELLNDVQCPVVLVPASYEPIDKVVMLYDGEPSSVHAVRTFSYLFESIKHFDTEIVTVKRPEESLHVPDNKLIKEFVKRHYPKAEYIVLKGVAEDEITNYLHRGKENAMVVLGAYRRSKFSRLFRPSMADYLLMHLKLPLFIAHNKS